MFAHNRDDHSKNFERTDLRRGSNISNEKWSKMFIHKLQNEVKKEMISAEYPKQNLAKLHKYAVKLCNKLKVFHNIYFNYRRFYNDHIKKYFTRGD